MKEIIRVTSIYYSQCYITYLSFTLLVVNCLQLFSVLSVIACHSGLNHEVMSEIWFMCMCMAQSCLFICLIIYFYFKQHGSSECWHSTEHTCVLLTLHTRRQCMKCHCCSCANMGYINVATFLLSNESTESITAGPRIVAEWNSDWRQTNFLTDFCEGQICTLETVFPGPILSCYIKLP